MYCKHCGRQIADDARFCDGCGKSVADEVNARIAVEEAPRKKKKKKGHPILGTIILVFGIIMLIGAFGGGSDEPSNVDNRATVETKPVETTIPRAFTIGDTQEMGDILVKLNAINEYKGSEYIKPADGNIFVVCEFTIENNTDSEIAVSSMMSFVAYFDDYAANLSISAMTINEGKQQLDGSVAPGKKMSGIIGYEVPKDWSEMEIRFSPNAFSSKEFIFSYSK